MKRKQKEPQRYMQKKGKARCSTRHNTSKGCPRLSLDSIPCSQSKFAVFNTGRHLPRLKLSFNSIPQKIHYQIQSSAFQPAAIISITIYLLVLFKDFT